MALLELVDSVREVDRATQPAPAVPAAVDGSGTAGSGAGVGLGLPAGLVRRASDLAGPAAGAGPDRLLPVAAELRALLPGGGLRRGSTAAVLAGPGSPGAERGPGGGPQPRVRQVSAGAGASGPAAGSTSLLLALLAEASSSGAWIAVVGMPELSAVAAAQAGIALSRLALIPYPGPEWTAVVAALLDGVDVVVAAPPAPVTARAASRLAARARQRGSVLVSYGRWEGADFTLSVEKGQWEGLGAGHGRLRSRRLVVAARGRGAAAWPRRAGVLLPGPAGRLAPAPGPMVAADPAPAGGGVPAGGATAVVAAVPRAVGRRAA